MKKVLWLASWYPNRMDTSDGDFIQRHARAVSTFCKIQVIYVVKALDGKEGGREERTEGNLSELVIYYTSPQTGIKLLDRILSQKKYNECYRQAINEYIAAQGQPDLVHVHVAMKAGLAALWMKKKWGIPYIVTEHWTGYYKQAKPSVHEYSAIYKGMAKKVLTEAAQFCPVSKDLGETVKQGFVNIPYQVVPNTVDTASFYYKPRPAAKFRFIHVSYMNYQKNPEGIIEAFKLLRQKGYDAELLMLGNTVSILQLAVSGDTLLNGNILFEDAVPYEEVAKRMQDSSAFLLFSRFENLPCVVLEALCSGLPVISTKVGGIPEVINAENGILVENGDTSQLVSAMQQMMDNFAVYNRVAIAEQAAAKFSYTTVGGEYAAIYEAL